MDLRSPALTDHKPAQRLLWFCVVGAIGYLVDVAVLLTTRDYLGVYGARLLSFMAAATATWVLNRRLTFSGRHAGVGLWAEYLRYLGLMVFGGAVNYAVYSLLAWQLPHSALLLAAYVGAGSVAGLVVNFLSASRLYRKQDPR